MTRSKTTCIGPILNQFRKIHEFMVPPKGTRGTKHTRPKIGKGLCRSPCSSGSGAAPLIVHFFFPVHFCPFCLQTANPKPDIEIRSRVPPGFAVNVGEEDWREVS